MWEGVANGQVRPHGGLACTTPIDNGQADRSLGGSESGHLPRGGSAPGGRPPPTAGMDDEVGTPFHWGWRAVCGPAGWGTACACAENGWADAGGVKRW